MKFLHTADWQVGMRATQLGDKGERVRHARLESARRVIEEARRETVDFVVVAGDTFENNGVDRIKVREVAKILGGAGCPVFLISGNHDALTPGSVWEDAVWSEFPNLHVLAKAEPVEVAGGVLYPCPVFAGDSKEDPTAWIHADTSKIAIGIAHGSVENAGYELSKIVGTLAFWGLFLFVLQMAFGMFGPNPISDLLTRMIAFIPNVFVAVVIVVITAAIAAGVKEIITASLGRMSYGKWVANGASVAILVVGTFAALSQLGIAPAIINGLFYAMLAIIVGCAIVAIGGGGIQPMRAQWEKALGHIESEAPRIQAEMQTATTGMDARERDLQTQLQPDPMEHLPRAQVYEQVPAENVPWMKK